MDICDIKPGMVEIFCRYITRNGKRIYPQNAKFFHFWVEEKVDSEFKDDLISKTNEN